eukprot:5856809-Prymnesium_polylepis.1
MSMLQSTSPRAEMLRTHVSPAAHATRERCIVYITGAMPHGDGNHCGNLKSGCRKMMLLVGRIPAGPRAWTSSTLLRPLVRVTGNVRLQPRREDGAHDQLERVLQQQRSAEQAQ